MASRQDHIETERPADWTEHRKFPRTNVVWEGKLETCGEVHDCIVLNLSANGAKLKLETPVTGHHWSGVLTIPKLGSFKAKVVWTTPKGSNELGLTFQDPPAAVALALADALPRSRAASVA